MATIESLINTIGVETDILAPAAMILGAALGDPTFRAWLSDDDLLLMPAVCVLDVMRARKCFEINYNREAVLDTVVSVMEAASRNKGDRTNGIDKRETLPRDMQVVVASSQGNGDYGMKARLETLESILDVIFPSGRRWASPRDFFRKFLRQCGIRETHTKRDVRRMKKEADALIRSAVLNGVFGRVRPSQLACAAFCATSETLISFREMSDFLMDVDDDKDTAYNTMDYLADVAGILEEVADYGPFVDEGFTAQISVLTMKDPDVQAAVEVATGGRGLVIKRLRAVSEVLGGVESIPGKLQVCG